MKFLEKFFDVELFFHENCSTLTRKLNELHRKDKKKKTRHFTKNFLKHSLQISQKKQHQKDWSDHAA